MSTPRRLTSDVGRFAIVPLWLLETGISDRALRLFAMLAARWADRDGVAWPSLETLAAAIGAPHRKAVTRAARELEACGALRIERRLQTDSLGGFVNRYHLQFAQPGSPARGAASENLAACTSGVKKNPTGGVESDPTGGVEKVQGVGSKRASRVGSNLTHEPDPCEPDPYEPDVHARAERVSLTESFEAFWTAYPRRVGKQAAWREWERLKPNAALQATIQAAVAAQQTWPQWNCDGGRYIPHPRTWLSQQRWLDEQPTPAAAPKLNRYTAAAVAAKENALYPEAGDQSQATELARVRSGRIGPAPAGKYDHRTIRASADSEEHDVITAAS